MRPALVPGRRTAILALALALAAPLFACAGQQASARGPDQGPAHRLFGEVTFDADFRIRGDAPPPRRALTPRGNAGMPHLRVCAIRRRGALDLAHHERLLDDERLACTTTERDGSFELDLPPSLCRKRRSGALHCDPKIYLATDLCAMRGGRAQTCVARNAALGPRVQDAGWSKERAERKFLWSPIYPLDLAARSSHRISWNLSCPEEEGLGRKAFACAKASRGGYFDRRHTSGGYKSDALHAYWAGAATMERFGDLVPRANTTQAPGDKICSARSAEGWRRRECTDAIRIVLRRDVKRGLGRSEGRPCTQGRRKDHVRSRRAVCMASPRNPYIVAHEIGHALHLRWMNYKGQLNYNVDGSAVQAANKTQTAEGWADFVAAAALHRRDDPAPAFNGHDLPAYAQRACRSGGGRSTAELSAGLFFWRLYQEHELGTLLEVWSMFPGGDGLENRDRTRGECNPDGRNLYDYRYHMQRHPGGLADPLPLMRDLCLDHQVQGTSCGRSPAPKTSSGRQPRRNR